MRKPARLGSVLMVVALVPAAIWACGDDDSNGGGPPANVDAGPNGDGVDTGVQIDSGSSSGGSGLFYKSGTRLRAELLKGDGDGKFESFIDTAKGNLSCDWADTNEADGKKRCLPRYQAALAFVDDQCTSPIAVTDICTKPEAVVFISDSSSVCNIFVQKVKEIRTIGAELATPPTKLFLKNISDGKCSEQPTGSASKYHALGAAQPLTDFVAGQAHTENASPALRRNRIIGDDGSEFVIPYDLVDVGRDAGCHESRITPPNTPLVYPYEAQCIPSRLAHTDLTGPFADLGCSIGAAVQIEGANCPPPLAIFQSLPPPIVDGGSSSNCGLDYGAAMRSVGAPLDAGWNNFGTCMQEPSTSRSFFALGAELPKSAFPSMTATALGPGRVRLLAMTTTDTAAPVILSHDGLYDEQTKTICTPLLFDDGKMYCVSNFDVTVPPRFKDAACTQPIYVSQQRCSPVTAVFEGLLGCGATGGLSAANVKPIGAAITGLTGYYEGSAAACNPTPTVLGPDNVPFEYKPTANVSSLFVPVTRVRE